MVTRATPLVPTVPRGVVTGVFAVSAALLITELALTRIFSVTMFYHFAFLAISIALFGLSDQSPCSRSYTATLENEFHLLKSTRS